MADIVQLEGDIFQVDLRECGYEGRTAGYFVRGSGGWALVETGPASSAGVVREAAAQLGIEPEQLKYIAVTHIHIDHAGGLGVLARHFPGAGLVVHPKGARHMIDPSRLIAGALQVWGEEKMRQYGDIVPVEEGRVLHAVEGAVLDLGDRKIEVWETPGHSKNHVCYYDAATGGLFSGDAAGVYSPGLSQRLRRPVLRPATPAPDFNGEQMFSSLLRIAASEIKQIYFTHFGAGRPPRLLVENIIGQLTVFMHMGRQCLQQGGGAREAADALAAVMRRYARFGLLEEEDVPAGMDGRMAQEWDFMVGMTKLSAQGIVQYLAKTSG